MNIAPGDGSQPDRSAAVLTARQAECVRLIAAGKSYKQIAVELGVKVTTVRSHLASAYQRLGVVSGAQAVATLANAPAVKVTDTRRPVERRGKQRVTDVQHLYLQAFDRYLRSGSDQDRAEMTHWLAGMCYEKGVPPKTGRPGKDPLWRLARTLARLENRSG